MPLKSVLSDQASCIAFVMISGLLLLRLLLVVTSPLELYADEAQYWRWGDTLEWGYYSKPPMIAWMIHLSTAIFGDSEWAIRILAPVFHTIAAVCLFLLSRKMFGSTAGLFTTVTYLLMPGVVLSSSVISTDGVLFPFWCLALLLFWRLREGEAGWLSVIALGTAIGIGFLSKYAMLYFAIGIALTCLIDRPTRSAVFSLKGAGFLAIAALVFAPHILWNAANDFKTVSHTVDNANLGGELFNLDHLPKFLTDQMGVFGPVAFIALMAAIFFLRPKGDLAAIGDAAHSNLTKERWLACFIVPVILIIAFQAILSRAGRWLFDQSERMALAAMGRGRPTGCCCSISGRPCHGPRQLDGSHGPRQRL
jgi:4-amino-4-deoxy-L-arabinose transferase-like glycosyltransferase